MQEEINTRVKTVRTALKVSQRDFAKRIYISQTLLGDIELGNRTVNKRTIQLISTAYNVNKTWLLTGEGEMFSSPPEDAQLTKLIDIFNQLDKPLKDYLLEQSKGLLKIKQTSK